MFAAISLADRNIRLVFGFTLAYLAVFIINSCVSLQNSSIDPSLRGVNLFGDKISELVDSPL